MANWGRLRMSKKTGLADDALSDIGGVEYLAFSYWKQAPPGFDRAGICQA